MDTRKLTVPEIRDFFTLNKFPADEEDLYGQFVSLMMSAALSNMVSSIQLPVGLVALQKSVVYYIPNFEQYSKGVVMSFNQAFTDHFCKYFVYETNYPNILQIIWRTIQLMYPLHRMQDIRLFNNFYLFDPNTAFSALTDVSDQVLGVLNNNKPNGLHVGPEDEMRNYYLNKGYNMQSYNKHRITLNKEANILEIDQTNIKYLIDTLKIDTASDPKLHFIRLREIGYDGVYVSKATSLTATSNLSKVSTLDAKYNAYLSSWPFSTLVIWNMSKVQTEYVPQVGAIPGISAGGIQLALVPGADVLTNSDSYQNRTNTSGSASTSYRTNGSTYQTDRSSSSRTNGTTYNQSTGYTSNASEDEDTSDEGEEFESDEDL